jgi:hypothetical protein
LWPILQVGSTFSCFFAIFAHQLFVLKTDLNISSMAHLGRWVLDHISSTQTFPGGWVAVIPFFVRVLLLFQGDCAAVLYFLATMIAFLYERVHFIK